VFHLVNPLVKLLMALAPSGFALFSVEWTWHGAGVSLNPSAPKSTPIEDQTSGNSGQPATRFSLAGFGQQGHSNRDVTLGKALLFQSIGCGKIHP